MAPIAPGREVESASLLGQAASRVCPVPVARTRNATVHSPRTHRSAAPVRMILVMCLMRSLTWVRNVIEKDRLVNKATEIEHRQGDGGPSGRQGDGGQGWPGGQATPALRASGSGPPLSTHRLRSSLGCLSMMFGTVLFSAM